MCMDNASDYLSELRVLKDSACKVYFPKIANQIFPRNQFGKLYLVNKPVICVAGTSSSQGKFSLQLSLREKFISAGYRIGQLGTEPTSLLFGKAKNNEHYKERIRATIYEHKDQYVSCGNGCYRLTYQVA